MAKKHIKEHTISIAVTAPMKKHIMKTAKKNNKRTSKFIADILEEKIGKPLEEQRVETNNPTINEQEQI